MPQNAHMPSQREVLLNNTSALLPQTTFKEKTELKAGPTAKIGEYVRASHGPSFLPDISPFFRYS
jgi:hypothetical protein